MIRIRPAHSHLLCLFLTLTLIAGCGEDPSPEPVVTEDRYVPPAANAAQDAPIPFVDITESTGLNYNHENGAFLTTEGKHSRYLPECMGPGVILCDFDGDELLDLYVPNGQPLAPDAEATPTYGLLAKNLGGMRFQDITKAANLEIPMYGMGGAAADLDGDNRPELLVTTLGGPRLFQQQAESTPPRFVEVTKEANLTVPEWTDRTGLRGKEWAVSAAFLDVDRDGDLDLFTVNYVRWSPANDVFESLDGVHKSYAIPRRYEGHTCRLFLNESEGRSLRFRDVTKAFGLLSTKAKGMSVALWDFNRDGQLDLFVTNDSQPNFLYLSKEDGTYEDQSQEANVAYDEDGRTRAGMGVAIEEYDGKGGIGIPIGNFSNEPLTLYHSDGDLLFRDRGQASGLAASTHSPLTFGLCWTDADLDGYPDLVIGNGHLEPEIQAVSAHIAYRQQPQLLRQVASGRFRDVTAAAGPAFQSRLVARGLARGDLDQDGDEDLVFVSNGAGLSVFRNDQNTGHRALRIDLQGTGRNQAALGTIIDLEFSDDSTRRLICRTGGSYASQSSLLPLVGLGSTLTVRAATVTWPDGQRETIDAETLQALRWKLTWRQ